MPNTTALDRIADALEALVVRQGPAPMRTNQRYVTAHHEPIGVPTNDPLFRALVGVAYEGFDGSATMLLDELWPGPHAGSPNWPSTASVLTRRIRHMSGMLNDAGVRCEIWRTNRGARVLLHR